MLSKVNTVVTAGPNSVLKLLFVVSSLLMAACGSGSDSNVDAELGADSGVVPVDVNYETIRLDLDDGQAYEWRVRGLSAQDPSPWSDKYYLEPENNAETGVELSVILDDDVSTQTLHDLLFYDEAVENEFLFYDDAGVGSEVATAQTSGIPVLSWPADPAASGYEVEVINSSTQKRSGVYQYAKAALCVNDLCELVIKDDNETVMDLPPVAMIVQTNAQGTSPYHAEFLSPVLNPADVQAVSHTWSIEGRFIEFPDSPVFKYSFEEAGSYTVNLMVDRPGGPTQFAVVDVNVSGDDLAGDNGGQSSAIQVALAQQKPVTDVSDVEDTEKPPTLGAASPTVENPDDNELSKPIVKLVVPEQTIVPITKPDVEPTVVPAPTETTGDSDPVEEEPTVIPEPDKEPDELPENEPDELPDNEPPTVVTDTGSGGGGTVPDSEPAPEIVAMEEASTLSFDGNLRMGGIFYGMPGSGWKTANAPISIQSSRRFMAERTGNIVSIRHFNRTLLDYDIENRCSPSNPSSVWCKCKNANLDAYTCGYTLSNSYTVGNGGTIVVEIRPDDGTDNHAPSDTVLGVSEKPFVPLDMAKEFYPEIPLAEPVNLKAGELYHIVYRNINPPTSCKLKGVSISEAASCPRNQGAMGLDGVSHQVDVGPTARFGPYLSESPAVLYRSSDSNSWRTSATVASWFEVKYDDGTWIGDSVVAYDAHVGEGKKELEGSDHGRQVFTITDATRTVDGLWLNHGHKDYANGRSMLVELKDESGKVLADGELPYSSECLEIVRNETNSFERGCRAWGYAELSASVDLLLGSTYSLELSSPQGAGFLVSTYFSLKHYGSNDRNHWTDAHAEFSDDGGASWDPWVNSFTERDFPMLFTIEGQPRQIR